MTMDTKIVGTFFPPLHYVYAEQQQKLQSCILSWCSDKAGLMTNCVLNGQDVVKILEFLTVSWGIWWS